MSRVHTMFCINLRLQRVTYMLTLIMWCYAVLCDCSCTAYSPLFCVCACNNYWFNKTDNRLVAAAIYKNSTQHCLYVLDSIIFHHFLRRYSHCSWDPIATATYFSFYKIFMYNIDIHESRLLYTFKHLPWCGIKVRYCSWYTLCTYCLVAASLYVLVSSLCSSILWKWGLRTLLIILLL